MARLLRLNGALPSGQQARVQLKAHRAPGDTQGYRWELRRLLPACGYPLTAATPLHRIVGDQCEAWQAAINGLGFDFAAEFGQSAFALARQGNAAASRTAEQEFWLGTGGVFIVLLFLPGHVRRGERKERALWVGRMLLSATLPPTLGWSFAGISAEHRELCRREPVVAGQCVCWHTMSPKFAQMHADSWHGRLWEALGFLFAARDCPAVAAHLGEGLRQIVRLVVENDSNWGEEQWEQSADAVVQGPVRPRRADQHVREWAVQGALQAKRFRTASQAVGSMASMTGESNARHWIDRHLEAFRQEMRARFSDTMALSLVWDGLRVGNPATEMVVAAISDLGSGCHGVLPPAEPQGRMRASLEVLSLALVSRPT